MGLRSNRTRGRKLGYNQDLEFRIDKLISQIGEISKKRMFGGIGYLVKGNMCFGIHKDYLILRISPEKAAKLMEDDNYLPFDITSKPMKGWVMITPDVLETEEQLLDVLKLGFDFADKLPRK
jgi:TfoX/Sxy family transcriptional regulator of competence genes